MNRFGHIEQAYGFIPVWVRSCRVAWLWWLNCLGQNEQQKGTVSAVSVVYAWTRSCCASLPGLRNRFWQCLHKCTVTISNAEVEPAVLDCPSDALPEAMPSSNCRGGCVDKRQRCFRQQQRRYSPVSASPGVPVTLSTIACACAASAATCCPRLPSRENVGGEWKVKERMTFPKSILRLLRPSHSQHKSDPVAR